MKIAVAGGTGLVGTHVVGVLSAMGHEQVILARSSGVDITTGTGLDAAVSGAGAVIDVSNVMASTKKASIAFFEAGTTRLLDAGARAGVRHHVILSIVGVDVIDFGYYLGKRRQEELALASGQPVTVLRSTQFHEFAGQLLDRGTGPIAVVPRMLIAPIAAREVAVALVERAVATPAGLAPELGGPDQHQLTDLARAVLAARGSRRRLITLRIPGAAGRAMAGGALVPTGDGPRGRQSFDEWLVELTVAQRQGTGR